ncbi:MAG: hypothetical protein ABW061_29195 [Polyangiaceae bacterium]
MRATCFLVVLGMLGCAGNPPAPVAEAAAQGSTISVEKSADSGQVDRVGPSDGALSADGTNDLGFAIQADGPIVALFLVAVDESGKPTGTYQADTLIGQTESPEELGARPGSGTSGLGVFEGDKALNTKEGSLDGVGDGPHRLTLYVAPAAALGTGTKLRVYAQRPDKSLVASAPVTN